MSRLICEKHKRRVMVLPSTFVVHRNDGSKCLHTQVSIAGKTFSPKTVAKFSEHNPR